MQFVCYQNGRFLLQSEASLPLSSLGFTRGYGAFELFRTYGRTPFYLKEHLARFKNSATALQLRYPSDVEEVTYTLLEKNPYDDLAFRLYLSEDEISGEMHFLVLIGKCPMVSDALREKGIFVITTSLARQLHLVKSTCYLSAILALKEAAAKGAEDAIFVREDGSLLELTKSNFFCISKGTLYTADEGVLPGITRNLTLLLAKELALPCKTKPFPLSNLSSIDEAFLTSTTREILPISKINDTIIPVGPLTKRLYKAFQKKFLIFT